MPLTAPTLLTPHGLSSTSCGYCGTDGDSGQRSKTSKSYMLCARQLASLYYQKMIDRGWRRSGDYVYHADMARTCCPLYTIRLDALKYKPSRKHRQVVNRFNRYVGQGIKPGESSTQGDVSSNGSSSKSKGTGGDWDFMTELKRYEDGWNPEEPPKGKHLYTTELVPAIATAETFDLFKRYQVHVHKDLEHEVTMRGFRQFLCDSPLTNDIIRYPRGKAAHRLPKTYGSYHMLYRLDGVLVGISVIDVLPNCVSSVYFIWHPDYAWASLGKLSAMREVALARDIFEAGIESMQYVYMGYWIPSCGKMVYKSEYSPSELLEPDTNRFYPLSPKLESYLKAHPKGYHPFEDILSGKLDKSQEREDSPEKMETEGGSDSHFAYESDWPQGLFPSFAHPSSFTDEEIDSLLVCLPSHGILQKTQVLALGMLQFMDDGEIHGVVRELVAAVGRDMMGIEGMEKKEWRYKGLLHFG